MVKLYEYKFTKGFIKMNYKYIDGGVCAAKGFKANGLNCGLNSNKNKNDLWGSEGKINEEEGKNLEKWLQILFCHRCLLLILPE